MLCEITDHSIYRRLYKTVDNFVSSNFTGLSIDNLSESKQPLNLIDALFRMQLLRKNSLVQG